MMAPYIRTETGSNKALHRTMAAIYMLSSVTDTVHLVTGIVADRTELICRCRLFANATVAP